MAIHFYNFSIASLTSMVYSGTVNGHGAKNGTLKNIHAVAVDDEPVNLRILSALSKDLELEITTFLSPVAALEYIQEHETDILFTDHIMKEMNGLDVIRRIHNFRPDIPILMVTGIADDDRLRLQALELGASDFLTKPLNLAEFRARVTSLIRLRRTQLRLQDHTLLLQDEIDRTTKEILQREMESLLVMARAAEHRNQESPDHVRRVALFSRIIGEQMNLTEMELDVLYHSSPLHDIGKIGIPDTILLKHGRLESDEYSLMKEHTRIGYDILKNTRSLYLQGGAIIALTHHERWNGSGYPDGRRAEEIPLMGRIVAVADVYDSLTSERSHRPPWDPEKALEFIRNGAASLFDPVVAEIFVSLHEEILTIHDQGKSETEDVSPVGESSEPE